MAQDRAEIERLQAEYRRARKQVTQKITRTKQRTGARLAGTKYDIRGALGGEKTLTKRQLQAGINRMKAFTSRSNQFVSGAGGAPIPQATARAFEKAQNDFNAKRVKLGANIDNKIVPGTSMTYKEKRAMMAENRLGGMPNQSLLSVSKVKVENVVSAEAMEKLTKKLNSRNTKTGVRKDIQLSKKILRDAAGVTMDSRLMKRLSRLSDEEAMMLYSDKDFMDNLFTIAGSPIGGAMGEDVTENSRRKVEGILGLDED